jgi:hypothetical protein
MQHLVRSQKHYTQRSQSQKVNYIPFSERQNYTEKNRSVLSQSRGGGGEHDSKGTAWRLWEHFVVVIQIYKCAQIHKTAHQKAIFLLTLKISYLREKRLN